MSGIFISYRRDDASGQAGRLFDRLKERFSEDHVFMDVTDLKPGQDFVTEIERALEGSDVMLAVIGPQWLDAMDSDGRRRLDDPEDFVRREVATALARKATVIPVLVRGAVMPDAAALPEPLRPLARRQAIELSDKRWKDDVDDLVAALEQPVPQAAPAARSEPGGARGAVGAVTETRKSPISLGLFALGLVVAIAGMWLWMKPNFKDTPSELTEKPSTVTRRAASDAERTPAAPAPAPAETKAASATLLSTPSSSAPSTGAASPGAFALTLPEVSEVKFRNPGAEVTYRILAIRSEPRDADSQHLTFLIRMHNHGSSGENFWDSSFRLVTGDRRLEPVTPLNEVADAHAAEDGEVKFLVPVSLTKAELEIAYRERDKTAIPIALGSRAPIPTDGSTDEFGRPTRARVVDKVKPLPASLRVGQRVKVGHAEFELVDATLERETSERAALSITVRCSVSREHYGTNFWSSSVRLVVDGVPRAPANSVNEVVSGGASKEAKFIFPLETMPESLDVRFFDTGDTGRVALDLSGKRDKPKPAPADRPVQAAKRSSERCLALLNRAQIGDPLSAAELQVLQKECR